MVAAVVAAPGRASAFDRVVAATEELVINDLEPGMRLPGEAELAERFAVSRLTVREALKVLAGRGLVELSRGRRPIVREPDPTVLSGYFAVAMRRDPHSLLELVEIRKALEVLAAGRAARTVSRASITAIESALQQMVAAAARDEPEREHRFHEADIAFHESLALASGNRMLAFVLTGFEESLRRSFAASYRGHHARGGSFDEVIAVHRAVLEAVRAGDAKAAERAMLAHLRQVERDLKAAVRAMSDGPTP